MARKRIDDVFELKNWEEVNVALKEIALCEIELTKIDGDMNEQINEIKDAAGTRAAIHKEKIADRERLIKDFVTAHKSEINGKTMTLSFGQTGFRKSESVSIPRGKDKVEAIIKSLKSNNMNDCIKVEESINKDVLKKYNEDTIIRVGASLVKKDVFWYETNKDTVNN